MDWINLAQNRNHWWNLMNTVMNLGIALKDEEFID